MKKREVEIPIGFALIILGELYGKSVVHHPSPYFFLLKNPEIATFPKYYIHSEFSYPSGHAARVSYIALLVFIIFGFKNWKKRAVLAIMLAGYVGAVALSQ
ncbi:MAG: phosphatase PAP2 family protein, partial [Thermodesulfobacteriota bacterium]